MYTNGMCRYHGGVLRQYVCAHMATSHKPSPYTCCICTFYIVIQFSSPQLLRASSMVILHVKTVSGCYQSATNANPAI